VQSADPLARPRIDPAYFSDPEDLRYAKEELRALLDIGAQQPFASNVQALNLPDRMPDDAALTEHIRRWSQTEYHTVGTCAMGVDENSVVDPSLRVRGIDNLRVVDASVMPTVISGNTNAAAIMIAEKGADLIKRSVG
jgi:choline dehydrogenase